MLDLAMILSAVGYMMHRGLPYTLDIDSTVRSHLFLSHPVRNSC